MWTFLNRSSYLLFLITCFITKLLGLLKLIGVAFNLPISNLSILLFKLFELLGTFSNSSISNLLISDFKLGKSSFLVNYDVSTSVAVLKSDFLA